MKGLWFEAYEQAWDEAEGKPSEAAVEAFFRDRVEALYDRADALRKLEREEGA